MFVKGELMQVEPRPIRFSAHGKIITVALIVTLVILLITSVGHVLTPFIAAIITAYLFNPLITWLQQRTRLRRSFWIVILYILIFSLLYGLGTWVWPRIVYQYDDLVSRLPDLVTSMSDSFIDQDSIEVGMGVSIDLKPLEEQVIGFVSDLGRTLSENVPHLVFSALETVLYALVYLIVTFYLLLQSKELNRWVVNLIPACYRDEICELGGQIDHVLSAYIRGQLLLILIMSVLTYIPLTILDVPYALVIAIATGVLEIIPIIGPWSAAAIAMVVALFQPEVPFGLSNLGLAGLIGVIYFTLRQFEDSFIIPNVVGHLVKLHPAVVIFAILSGGAIAGALGLLIAIPLAAVIRILLSYLYPKITDNLTPPDPLISMEDSPGSAAETFDAASQAQASRTQEPTSEGSPAVHPRSRVKI
jgi:predicted PurR-regulated permease PerM